MTNEARKCIVDGLMLLRFEENPPMVGNNDDAADVISSSALIAATHEFEDGELDTKELFDVAQEIHKIFAE